MITFKEHTTISGEFGGLIFWAIYQDKTIPIKVSMEAIQDIDPRDNSELQKKFEANRSTFESIAESKIMDGNSKPLITTKDLNAKPHALRPSGAAG